MFSLLDPLPVEAQQLVDLVATTYASAGDWPVWQYVVQQMWLDHGLDAHATLRGLPGWPWLTWQRYRPVRTIPGEGGGSVPSDHARVVLTVYGMHHASKDSEHPLLLAFLKAVEVAAEQQENVTVSPLSTKRITIGGRHLAEVVSHRTPVPIPADVIGMLLQDEPVTAGGGTTGSDDWTWDLTHGRRFRTFVSKDSRGYLAKLDEFLGSREEDEPYTAVGPDSLPRALDHLNVAWKAATGNRLFYPRGLASAASLTEPVNNGDQLTVRLGALADVFDLFLRSPEGRSAKGGSLNKFCEDLVNQVPAGAQEQARAAVGRLLNVNYIRNGRLHTDDKKGTEALRMLRMPPNESPEQQWERIRAVTVDAVYTIIQLLEQLIP